MTSSGVSGLSGSGATSGVLGSGGISGFSGPGISGGTSAVSFDTSQIGDYDQAMVLTQYLINNGIDNLWVRDGNNDTPITAAFTVSLDGIGSLQNASLASPRIILQPESDPLGLQDSETLIFQLRFKSGQFISKLGASGPLTFDLSGWKVGYRAMIYSADVDSTKMQQLSAKLPSLPNGASYSITQLKLKLLMSDSNPMQQSNAYTDWASSTGSLTDSHVANFHRVFLQKLIEMDKNDLLITGYNVRAPSSQGKSRLFYCPLFSIAPTLSLLRKHICCNSVSPYTS